MNIFIALLLPVIAYALGSISSAVWVANTFYKTDIRKHGSKNAGATNVLRVLGHKAAIPVFLFDILKGVLAVLLIHFTDLEKGTEAYTGYEIVLGTCAVLGHIIPLFASFKGGKGVATIAGIMLAINPGAVAVALGIFVICFLTTHYVSLSSITAAIFFPFIVIVIFGCWLRSEATTLTMEIFSVITAAIIVVTHRKNIRRLCNGTESKISFKKKTDVN
ncbi:MAG: glycerol-3-phosphate 1-O-acyltransferase PlsY [Prevotellaceae bacterium]|jgi:glycerol-3-phosphate acyltransferase PlsY|nr:glycerol-3-phosphate 1-O-acyltransferase PlsY [Prevotellaceae bacterium]